MRVFEDTQSIMVYSVWINFLGGNGGEKWLDVAV